MESATGAIRLAEEGAFVLGSATVRPAMSEVACGRTRVRLQPRVMQVLVALAQANGEVVSRERLLARCWGGAVVGEDALNRCIQRLRKLSAEVPGCFEVATIARVGFRLERLGGATSEAPEPASPKVPPARVERPASPRATGFSRGWAAGLVVLAVAAGGGGGFWAVNTSREPASGAKVSIVVAPLEVRDNDVPAHIVQAGLSDDVARAMVANPLQVSVAAPDPNAPHPPGRLILDGAAFTVGATLQAQLRLRDAASQEILWAKSFTGQAASADALREMAALKVGAVLNCALRTPQSADVTADAKRLYLAACDDIGDSDARAALDKLKRLTAITPRFAQAWAELAATLATTAGDLQPAQRTAAYEEAVSDARRALNLDPHTGLAYFALVEASPGLRRWPQRMALLEAGLKAEPEAANLDNLMGHALLQVGRTAEGVVYLQRAVDLDPLSPVKEASLIGALTDAGRLGAAEDEIGKADRVWSRDPRIWSRAFFAEARLGDPVRAERLIDDPRRPALSDPDEAAYWRARLRYRRRPTAASQTAALEVMAATSRALDRGEEIERAYELASVDRPDLAYAVLDAAAPGRTSDAESLLFRRELAGFRADRRFIPLAERLGLVGIWRASGHWPDFCTGPHAPYDCAAVAARPPDQRAGTGDSQAGAGVLRRSKPRESGRKALG